jgi:hypothetical protein
MFKINIILLFGVLSLVIAISPYDSYSNYWYTPKKIVCGEVIVNINPISNINITINPFINYDTSQVQINGPIKINGLCVVNHKFKFC